MEVCRFQVLLVFFMVYATGNVADIGKADRLTDCSTLLSAKTLNDEITKLFSTVSFAEIIRSYFPDWYEKKFENPYKGCQLFYFEPDEYFRNYIYLRLKVMADEAEYYEELTRGAEIQKKDILDVAELFKNSWMKLKKILRIEERLFQAFDMFFVDNVMERAAIMGAKAQNKTLMRGGAGFYAGDFLEYFEDIEALMKMIPNRKLLNTPTIFNVIFNQLHSALRNTTYSFFLWQIPDSHRFKLFTDVSIKYNIKRSSKHLVHAYAIGYEEAANNSIEAIKIEEMLSTVIEKINTITPMGKSGWLQDRCKAAEKEAGALAKASGTAAAALRENAKQTLFKYTEKLSKWFSEAVDLPRLINEVREAMSFIKSYIPTFKHEELNKLYVYVTSSIRSSDMPKTVWEDIRYFARGEIEYMLSNKYWFKPFQELFDMLTKTETLFGCYLKVYQFFGKTFESCSDGVGSLQHIYDEISSQITFDETKCWSLFEFSRPSFPDIQLFIEKAAKKFGFNKECKQNNQQDEPGDVRSIVIDDYSDESEKKKFSPSQRFMVCNLRGNWSKSDEEINDMMAVRDLLKVKAVRCKDSKRADSKYAREKQVDRDHD